MAPAAAVWFLAGRSLRPPRTVTPAPALPPGARVDDVAFPSGGGTLRGWMVSPPDPQAMVLLVHGWGGDAAAMLRWSRFLAEAGFATLAFDQRGHGRSDSVRVLSPVQIAEDVRAAAAFLDDQAPHGALPRIVLGHSMGGAGVLIALDRGLRVRAVVLSSVFARVQTVTERFLSERGLPVRPLRGVVRHLWELRVRENLTRLEPAILVQRIEVPLLLTHGDRDETISPEELHVLERHSPEHLTESLLVLGAGHSDLTDFADYRAGVSRFLQRVLSRAEA